MARCASRYPIASLRSSMVSRPAAILLAIQDPLITRMIEDDSPFASLDNGRRVRMSRVRLKQYDRTSGY